MPRPKEQNFAPAHYTTWDWEHVGDSETQNIGMDLYGTKELVASSGKKKPKKGRFVQKKKSKNILGMGTHWGFGGNSYRSIFLDFIVEYLRSE